MGDAGAMCTVGLMLKRGQGVAKDFLFGKEQKLKEISEKFYKQIKLEIYEVTVNDCEQPKQKFTLDKDMKEFLQKSGVELKLETKNI